MEEWAGDPVSAEGHLDLRDDGYGFLRVNGFLPSRDDVYVPVKFVRQYGLRKGDHLLGALRSGASVVIILFNLNCREMRVCLSCLFVGELLQTAQGGAVQFNACKRPDIMTVSESWLLQQQIENLFC